MESLDARGDTIQTRGKRQNKSRMIKSNYHLRLTPFQMSLNESSTRGEQGLCRED